MESQILLPNKHLPVGSHIRYEAESVGLTLGHATVISNTNDHATANLLLYSVIQNVS